jgi:hypothetical protein
MSEAMSEAMSEEVITITIVGPDERIETTPPPSPNPHIATSHLLESEDGQVTLAINGNIEVLDAYAAIDVSKDITDYLEQIGYELEYM